MESRSGPVGAVALRAAGWLALAAAPTFAGMAWLSTGDATALCSSGSGMPPMGGMASMFLLMSFFHLPPWLKLVSRRREIVSCNRIEGD